MDSRLTRYHKTNNMEELLKEKEALEARIAEKHREAEAATDASYWLKKRVKLIERQLAAMSKSDAEALKEIAEGMR
jgi:hypothetical protein